jgi:hypothetical protein
LLIWRWSRLIVRRFCAARARHHSIGLPSIVRSTCAVTVRDRSAACAERR